jgi:hypothetical protein
MTNKKPPKKISVAKILGLMEERGKHKDWLLEEAKRSKLNLRIAPTANSYEILKNAPKEFVLQIYNTLTEEEFQIEDIKSMTKTFHWFFTDIVGASNPSITTKAQVRKITVLNDLIKRTSVIQKASLENTPILPTGDGMAIGFADSPEQPLKLAIELHKQLTKYNQTRNRNNDKLFLRIGIDSGPVYVIKDLTGNNSVWGPGIIMARRVMDLCGDNQIYVSSRIAEHVSNLSSEYKAIMHPVGDYTTKHDEKLVIYNVYDKNVGNKYAKRKGKIFKRKESFQETLKTKTAFVFNQIGIELDVIDPKTMLTHHKWIWNVINMSDEPRKDIFYYVDGDVPKDFKSMNVKVTDEDGNELDISSINVNKPLHKEFNVMMKNPLKPRSKNRFLTMEYDWEEPERNFFYKLPTDCKKFRYRFTIPSGVDIKNRILKVDTELGYKWLVEPPPRVSYNKDHTLVEWEVENLKAYDAYKFEW